ncbi:hypothetical protein HDE_07335 [Halotydeus destructor]|nr:hypothetical protein HDE_07335 [Halotydeus destructor]
MFSQLIKRRISQSVALMKNPDKGDGVKSSVDKLTEGADKLKQKLTETLKPEVVQQKASEGKKKLEETSKVIQERLKKKFDEIKKAADKPLKMEATKGGGGGFSKLNLLGLPLVGLVLFYFLPNVRLDDVHSIDWYKKHPDYWKDRDAKMTKEHKLDCTDKGMYPEQDKGNIDLSISRNN